jgi:hypothetical protein
VFHGWPPEAARTLADVARRVGTAVEMHEHWKLFERHRHGGQDVPAEARGGLFLLSLVSHAEEEEKERAAAGETPLASATALDDLVTRVTEANDVDGDRLLGWALGCTDHRRADEVISDLQSDEPEGEVMDESENCPPCRAGAVRTGVRGVSDAADDPFRALREFLAGLPPDTRARLEEEPPDVRIMLYTDAPPVPDALLRVMLFLTAQNGPPATSHDGHYQWAVGEPDEEVDGAPSQWVSVTFGLRAANPNGLVEVMVFDEVTAYAVIGCCVQHAVAYRTPHEIIAAWDDEERQKRAEEAAAASRARKRPKVVPLRPGSDGGGA